MKQNIFYFNPAFKPHSFTFFYKLFCAAKYTVYETALSARMLGREKNTFCLLFIVKRNWGLKVAVRVRGRTPSSLCLEEEGHLFLLDRLILMTA